LDEVDLDNNINNEEVDGNNTEDDENVCKVCFDRKIDIVLVPCFHYCICEDCSSVVMEQNKLCPICNIHIDKAQKLYKV